MRTISYAEVKPGDRIWNNTGYGSPRGHWTRVLKSETIGGSVYLTTADGYAQVGHPREGITIDRPVDLIEAAKAAGILIIARVQ